MRSFTSSSKSPRPPMKGRPCRTCDVQYERDKERLRELVTNNDETWLLTHPWFTNDKFEYILDDSRTSFILYMPSTSCYHIMFCLTDKTHRRRGQFEACLNQLKTKANACDFYIVADIYECNLSDWNKRDFVVSRDTSGAGYEYREIIWGGYTRSISRGIVSNVQTAEEESE